MAGASCTHTGARWSLFKKAAQLNEAKVPAWSGCSVFGLPALCLTGKYGDLLDFVVIIVLIFYILTTSLYST
jgi:APA family basic amino acid/polyamine antiporter